MILDEIQALKVLKDNINPPPFILTSREQSNNLFALIHGDMFLETLLRIEGIESKEKAIARKKYSRNIVHFYDRLLRPNANVYSANGGSVHFDVSDSEKQELMYGLGRARDGKSLREWLKCNWMPMYHADPNGVVFMEYETIPDTKCWPTYKNIDDIRAYKPKGQLVDWILFEPFDAKINNQLVKIYRLVDDKTDRKYYKKGNEFILLDTLNGKPATFEHPFGQVPCIINSDIKKFKHNYRLSPINSVLELSEEYARDQSVKTLYKKYMGFPKEWKYVEQCDTCQGAGKDDEGDHCKTCDGHGYYKSTDVTDIRTLPVPKDKDDVKIAPDISGFITPPLETWGQYNEELEVLDQMAYSTHWGTMTGFASKVVKTATEIHYSTQPMTDKLNDLADVGESIENQLVEWYANFIFPLKAKDKRISSINYGRRYIIDPPDVLLSQYEKAKNEGDNSVILDRMYNEYLTAKFRRDPEFLRVMLLKSDVEPYLHLTDDKVIKIFNNIEAQKKVLFQKWWSMLTSVDFSKTAENLTTEFDAWFLKQAIVQIPPTNPNEGQGRFN